MKKTYDVIIAGAGPAGIFTALELITCNPSLDVLIIEKGPPIASRSCPLLHGAKSCMQCVECAILSGWGGAGAFSDGKLTLSPDVGGFLERYISRQQLISLIDYVDSIYLSYGASQIIYGTDEDKVQRIAALAKKNRLKFIPSKIRHIGTNKCLELLSSMYDELDQKVTIKFNNVVDEIITDDECDIVRGIRLEDGGIYEAPYVVLAPGREGSKWLEGITRKMNIETLRNPVDLGVRVEVPAAVLSNLTEVVYEPKIIYESMLFNDTIRTFCVNPHGEVVKEHLDGIWSVNGHSFAEKRTENTNFALLVSSVFTEPFDEPISYGRHIAELANYLGRGVLVQRLGDLRRGRRSTDARIRSGNVSPTLRDATAGDLSFVLPYRHMTAILEMLEALDNIAPGVNSEHTLLYGVEVKFYSLQLKLSETLETSVSGLYAVGDGAGVSRGLIQSSVSGVLAARSIIAQIG